jgi:hypothetical protein
MVSSIRNASSKVLTPAAELSVPVTRRKPYGDLRQPSGDGS